MRNHFDPFVTLIDYLCPKGWTIPSNPYENALGAMVHDFTKDQNRITIAETIDSAMVMVYYGSTFYEMQARSEQAILEFLRDFLNI